MRQSAGRLVASIFFQCSTVYYCDVIKQKLCKHSTSLYFFCLRVSFCEKMAMMDHQKPSPLGMSRIPAGTGPVGAGPDRFVPTQKELDKIQNAIHDPTFRAMLVDYAKQMNDPNNR